jgi:hypothetical protein
MRSREQGEKAEWSLYTGPPHLRSPTNAWPFNLCEGRDVLRDEEGGKCTALV